MSKQKRKSILPADMGEFDTKYCPICGRPFKVARPLCEQLYGEELCSVCLQKLTWHMEEADTYEEFDIEEIRAEYAKWKSTNTRKGVK